MKIILKTALFLASFLLLQFNANAQKKAKDIIFQNAEIGLAALPSAHGAFVTIKGASAEFMDSIRKADKLKTNLALGLQFRFETGRNWIVTSGIYYSNKGLTRVKTPVNLLDEIHKNMPIGKKVIKDDMQGFEREIYYNVNYHFLQFPVLFGKDFTPREMKYGDWKMSWFMGGSLEGMLWHDMKIEFRGFDPFGGMSSYTLNKNETEFKPLVVNISAVIGGRIDVNLYPKMRLYLQPTISKQLLYASYGIEKHHLYTLSAEIGISYAIDQDKKEKTL